MGKSLGVQSVSLQNEEVSCLQPAFLTKSPIPSCTSGEIQSNHLHEHNYSNDEIGLPKGTSIDTIHLASCHSVNLGLLLLESKKLHSVFRQKHVREHSHRIQGRVPPMESDEDVLQGEYNISELSVTP